MERYFGSISTEQFENTCLGEKKVTGNKSIGKITELEENLDKVWSCGKSLGWMEAAPTPSLCREVKKGPEGRRVLPKVNHILGEWMEILLDRVHVEGSLVKALHGFWLLQGTYVYKTNWEVGDICLQ